MLVLSLDDDLFINTYLCVAKDKILFKIRNNIDPFGRFDLMACLFHCEFQSFFLFCRFRI